VEATLEWAYRELGHTKWNYIEESQINDYDLMFNDVQQVLKPSPTKQQGESKNVDLSVRQPFEDYPELSYSIMHAASHWKTDSEWSNHLEQISKVCHELTELKKQHQKDVVALDGYINNVNELLERIKNFPI